MEDRRRDCLEKRIKEVKEEHHEKAYAENKGGVGLINISMLVFLLVYLTMYCGR